MTPPEPPSTPPGRRGFLPAVLVVLDGWGEAPPSEWNAVVNCRPEAIEALRGRYATTLLEASGEAVGLPPGQIGNSEVGHLCLGSGRVVLQDLPRITRAVRTGEFFRNAALLSAMDAAALSGGALHLLGLFSAGGVHSHVDHLRALVSMARPRVRRVLVHAFLDGRDVPPKSALELMTAFEKELAAEGDSVRVASVQGRFFAMDRDSRWDRIERAWRALVRGEGLRAPSGTEAIAAGYARGETDEFLQPTVVENPSGEPVGLIRGGDAAIHFNFRADRARELTRALVMEDFQHFDRAARPALSAYCGFGEYDKTFNLPVAFPGAPPRHVFGEVLAGAGLRQARMAETEKYAHVTYFFNGGREVPFDSERRVLVPSDRKVATYDLEPGMRAQAVTEETRKWLRGEEGDFLLVNFANPDMVGHTGVYEAALRACSLVDRCVGQIVSDVVELGGLAVVTADHGNAEQMYDPVTRGPHTAHTTNPVPCIFASERLRGLRLRAGGMLSDVIPTLLGLLELPQPADMDGRPLLRAD